MTMKWNKTLARLCSVRVVYSRYLNVAVLIFGEISNKLATVGEALQDLSTHGNQPKPLHPRKLFLLFSPSLSDDLHDLISARTTNECNQGVAALDGIQPPTRSIQKSSIEREWTVFRTAQGVRVRAPPLLRQWPDKPYRKVS